VEEGLLLLAVEEDEYERQLAVGSQCRPLTDTIMYEALGYDYVWTPLQGYNMP
jgi:hypothetical protein